MCACACVYELIYVFISQYTHSCTSSFHNFSWYPLIQSYVLTHPPRQFIFTSFARKRLQMSWLEKLGKKRKDKELGTEKPWPAFLWQIHCPLVLLFWPMDSYPSVRDINKVMIFLGELVHGDMTFYYLWAGVGWLWKLMSRGEEKEEGVGEGGGERGFVKPMHYFLLHSTLAVWPQICYLSLCAWFSLYGIGNDSQWN